MKRLCLSQFELAAFREGRLKVVMRRMKNQLNDSLELPYLNDDGQWRVAYNNPPHEYKTFPLNSPFRPGETVFVGETWRFDGFGPAYKALALPSFAKLHKWRSPITFPEKFARFRIRIGDVKPVKVQDVTEEDAAQIIPSCDFKERPEDCVCYLCEVTKKGKRCLMKMGFKGYWESLHPGSWERNDWAWRIELRR